MSAAIYKQGQGYWVRVLTAIFVGALVLAAAAWAYSQAAAIKLPQPTQRVNLAAVRGDAPAQGSTIDVFTILNAERVRVGSAVVETFETQSAGSADLIVRDVALDSGELLLAGGDFIQAGEGLGGTAAEPLRAEIVSAVGINVIEPIYLQAGLAGAILLIGSVVIYIFVGLRKPAVDFLIATDGEMKKVNWSTRKEIQGSTIVVVVATFLLAAGIFVVDYGFGAFFRFIDVLQ